MLGSTRENLLPKVHLGRIVLRPGHVRLVVKDEIFLLGPRHSRPLNPRAKKVGYTGKVGEVEKNVNLNKRRMQRGSCQPILWTEAHFED